MTVNESISGKGWSYFYINLKKKRHRKLYGLVRACSQKDVFTKYPQNQPVTRNRKNSTERSLCHEIRTSGG